MRITPLTKIIIDAVTMECIKHWTKKAAGEFSCLADVSDTLVISNAQLLDQECTGVSTDLDQEAIAAAMLRHEAPEKMRAWVHSHADMQTYWSEQDEETIEAMRNDSFLVSIVVNKKGAVRCRLDVFRPIRITLDQLPHEVRFMDDDLKAWCLAEFDSKVSEYATSPTSYLQSRTFGTAGNWRPQVRNNNYQQWHLLDDEPEGVPP